MGRLDRAVLNNLARGAGNTAIGSGRLLNSAIVHPQTMLQCRRFTVPVEHSYPQQMDL
jgi:hypothetical protein